MADARAPKRAIPPQIRVLKNKQYRLYFIANGLSLIGSWMQRIACGWLVWEWTGSVFWLGVLAAGDLLPVIIIGPIAGVAADRWDRLKQNRIVQFVSSILALTISILLFADQLGLYSLIALVTVQGTLGAAVQPARLAMIQQLVPREDMPVAVALSSINVNLARLIGPAIAGAMILRMDVFWIFLINAIVTLNFVFILGRIRLTPRTSFPVQGRFWTQLIDGLTYVVKTPALRFMLGMLLVGGALVRSMMELIPAIAAETFSNTATGLAVLTGASAVGAISAGLAMGDTTPAKLIKAAMIWWLIGAVATLFLTHSNVALIAIIASAFVGAAITRCMVGTQTFVQLTTPDILRGRTLSVHGLLARGSPALGALAIGTAADQFGLAATVAVSCAAFIIMIVSLMPLIRHYQNISNAD